MKWDEQTAIREIDAAIHEIKMAANDEGKNIDDRPPVDAHKDWKGKGLLSGLVCAGCQSRDATQEGLPPGSDAGDTTQPTDGGPSDGGSLDPDGGGVDSGGGNLDSDSGEGGPGCTTLSGRPRGLDGEQIADVLECANVTYDPVVNVPEVMLDMYVHPGYHAGTRAPAIIFIHGGGWFSGSKTEVGPQQFEYLKSGRPALTQMLGAPISDPPIGVTASVTPLTYVDAEDPPMYLLAENAIAPIPRNRSRTSARRRRPRVAA